MPSSFWLDTINLEYSIVHIIRWCQVMIKKKYCIFFTAFHVGLNYKGLNQCELRGIHSDDLPHIIVYYAPSCALQPISLHGN